MKSLHISKQDLQCLEGLEEFFRGNSRITSDLPGMQYFKTLSGCLCQQKLFGVRLLVVGIQVNCAAISAILRSSTLVKSYNSSEEGIISFEGTKMNHDKLPRENNRLWITTRQITLYIICINFQVVCFENKNLGLLTQFVKK